MTASKPPLRISLVGCGKAADNHVSQVQHIPNVKLVSVCDRELLMAEQLATRYSVPGCYANYTHMLQQERPDVVHITTPPQSHFELAAIALGYGCHVLVEKPITCSHIETQRLLASAKAADRKLTVAWGYFFDQIARDMRVRIRSGEIGAVVHVNSHFGYDLTGSFGSSVLSDSDHWVHGLPAKLIHNVADHIFNKIVEFLPIQEPVLDVVMWPGDSALSQQALSSEMRVLIRDGPMTATAIFSAAARPVLHQFQVFGTKGSLSLDFASGMLTAFVTPRIRGALGSLFSGYGDVLRRLTYANRNAVRLGKGQFGHFAGLRFLFSSFYQSIREDCPPPISNDLILKASELMERVLSQPKRATWNTQQSA
jgi:predicted dehydrogenase